MTDDIIRAIDATVDSLCACGCGTRLDPDGPSVWYVSEKHQNDHAHRTSETLPPDVLDADPYGGANGWYERLRQQAWEQANLTVSRGGIRFPLTVGQQTDQSGSPGPEPANCSDCNPSHPVRYTAKLTSIRVQALDLPRPNLLRRILATLTQPVRRNRP